MLFVKRGERVEAEAAALAAGRHPGVIDLVDVADGALRTTLVEGARSLAEIGPLTPDEIAGVLASVGGTLADLHERAVVHGGLEAGHVLVCPDGRTVLCSLGRGGEPADDVAALGCMIGGLLSTARPDVPASANGKRARAGMRPFRRTSRLGPMLAPAAAPVLAGIVAEATAPDPDGRPSARALAAAVHQRVPTARLPIPHQRPLFPLAAPSGKGRRRPGRNRPPADAPVEVAGKGAFHVGGVVAAVAAGNAVLLAAVVVMSHVLADRGTGSRPPVRTPASRHGAQPQDAAGPSRPTATSAPVAVRVWPPEPLDFRDGVLTVDGTRYAVGLPGDAVVAGDWACTGRRTLALLRPATGEVFAFDGWPGAGGQETTARPVGNVDGGTGVRALDANGDGCDNLEVTRAGAPPVHLEPAA